MQLYDDATGIRTHGPIPLPCFFTRRERYNHYTIETFVGREEYLDIFHCMQLKAGVLYSQKRKEINAEIS